MRETRHEKRWGNYFVLLNVWSNESCNKKWQTSRGLSNQRIRICNLQNLFWIVKMIEDKNFLKVQISDYWKLPDSIKPTLLSELKKRLKILSEDKKWFVINVAKSFYGREWLLTKERKKEFIIFNAGIGMRNVSNLSN